MNALKSLPVILLTALTVPASLLPAQTVEDSTTVVAVEVPVHVLRDGEPVRGLTVDDFEILEGRKRHRITGFEVVDLSHIGAAAPEPADAAAATTETPARLPMSSRRHFLFLFDLSFSEPSAIVRARDAAKRLVDQNLHPTDLVAVATYTSSKGPRLLHGFTSDRRQALLAIDTLGLSQRVRPVQDPLGLIFGNLEGAESDDGGFESPGGDSLAAHLQDLARVAENLDRRHYQQRIQALSASLADLGKLMSSVSGRKHVLYLSEGFDTSVVFGTVDRAAQQRMNRAAEAGRVWEIDSEERFGSSREQNVLDAMFESFRRADCTIQAIDIGGLRAAGDVAAGNQRASQRNQATLAGRQDSLALMARATGGEFLYNFNDLSSAMSEVLERTGVTYVLTFQPENLKLDGEYHKLKVKLRDGVRKARVVHRPGYYAPQPFAATPAAARRLAAAERVLGGDEGGVVDLAVTAAPMPAVGSPVYIPLALAVDGRSLRGGTEGTLQAEIFVYAIAADGRVRDYLSHSLAIDLAKVGDRLEASGLGFFGHLDLPPGAYQLRSFVRNGESGDFGLRSVALEVPDFDLGEPALWPPLFVGQPGSAIMLREDLAAGEAPPYPYMARGQPFLPDLRPVLAGDGPAAVHVAAYGFGDEGFEISGRVVAAGGESVDGVELVLADPVDVGEGRVEIAATLAAGELPAGDYVLEVTAANPWTATEATAASPFTVRR